MLTAALAAALLLPGGPACKSHSKKKSGEEKPAAQAAENVPKTGGHLRLPSNEPLYLNPLLQTQLDMANPLIFEGLIGLDSRLDPVERLATRWELSNDGKTLTFKLRENVKWHDGEPFTARDVEFTFNAIRETRAASVWKGYMAPVESLTVPDEHTVVVTYKEPFAPALMAWTVGILPRHVYGGGDLAQSPANKEPIGTGPYKLQRWEPGKRLLLAANDSWWYGRPYIDSIELLVDIPQEKVVEALNKGDIDFADVSDITLWRDHLQSPEFRESFEVSDVVEAHFRVIAWNTQRQHLADKRVRLALTLALDRGRLIDEVLFGQARPLSGPFFPNMYGADPSIAPYPFDPARAAALLDEAGYPSKDGESRFKLQVMALESQSNPLTNTTFGMYRDDLARIGVELELVHVTPAEFFARTSSRDFDAAYFGWLPDIADPDVFGLLHSSMVEGGSNYAGYQNPELDALLEQARHTTDRVKRKALYYQVHRIVHEDLPYTTLYAPLGHYAWSRRVRGVNPSDMGSQPRFPGVARWWLTSLPPGARRNQGTP